MLVIERKQGSRVMTSRVCRCRIPQGAEARRPGYGAIDSAEFSWLQQRPPYVFFCAMRKSARGCTITDRRDHYLCRVRCPGELGGGSASSPMELSRGWVEGAPSAQDRRACSAQLELSLGAVVGPGEYERVAAERGVADRVAMAGRGGVEYPGALVVASVKLL